MPLLKRVMENPLAERLNYEHEAKSAGFAKVAGVDEAGRGPLAGPVVAACVILPEDVSGLEEVNDSKRLTPAKRERLYQRIHERALGIGVGIADAPTIDRLNILQATFFAMHQAVESTVPKPDYLLIDGNRRPQWAENAALIVAGDSLSLSIAAASIIAKVTRDRMMEEFDRIFPQWGFGRHKGYGTAGHLDAIRKYGVCDLHRRSFYPITQIDFGLERS